MRALIFVYIIKEVAHLLSGSHQNLGLRSRAEAVEQDLLVAYLVIDICGFVQYTKCFRCIITMICMRFVVQRNLQGWVYAA